MKYGLIALLIYTLVPIILNLCILPHKSDKNVLVYPRSFIFVGCLGIVIINFAIVMFLKDGYNNKFLFLLIFVVCLQLAVWWLVLQALNWKLKLNDDCIVYRNFLRVTKTYQYSQVVKVKMCFSKKKKHCEKYKIFVDDKTITVENVVLGFDSLPKRLKNRLNKNGYKCEFEK